MQHNFHYCNFNVYLYIFTCGQYIQIFLVWPFMPKIWNFNHSVWLILYSKPLDLKCMKWIKSTFCSYCCTEINLFFYSVQLWAQNIGQSSVLRIPEPCIRSMYAEITFLKHTSLHLKGDDWTEGQCRVDQSPSMNEPNRQRATKRKLTVLSHK